MELEPISQKDVEKAFVIGVAEENARLTKALYRAVGISEIFRNPAKENVIITPEKWAELMRDLYQVG